MSILKIGDLSKNGQITIVDEDRLCYIVQSMSRGAKGLRTISKNLLTEFVDYRKSHPNCSANDARDALSGKTDIDKFEYGYASTLLVMSDMILSKLKQENIESACNLNIPRSCQIIYYGAPGTGKSHAINTHTSTKSVIRTTFHPDSDYSTFVGAYKPTTEEQTRYNDSGVPVIYHDGDHKGEPIKDKVIVYDFVEQAFLKAYEEAWKKFFANPEAPEDEYLVIEEINRGNCAQIFGDLFQLLDRNQYGYSEYPITADNDISKHLKDVFTKEQLQLDDHDIINHMYNRGDGDIAQKVLNGDILLLPKNLYIWATMNTSDQSLFPIDSAFKRRWDWQYVKIADAGKGWKIKCGDEYCDWWTFIEEINKKIAKETSSDDKKLGYFFCKPPKDGDIITEETFVGKVLFYLWNDVFKDGDITLFKVNDDPEAEICFDAFYTSDNKVNVEAIRKFLVGVVGEENLMSKDDADDEALEASITGGM